MEEFKNHLIQIHQKEKHNWMVQDIESEFSCDECDLVYPRRSRLQSHMDTNHSGDRKEVQQSIEPKMFDEEPKENSPKVKCQICEGSCISTKDFN